MDYIILLLIILIVLLCGWQGYKKGFLRILLSIVSIFLAIFIAVKVEPVVYSVLIEKTEVHQKIESTVYDVVLDYLQQKTSGAIEENKYNLFSNAAKDEPDTPEGALWFLWKDLLDLSGSALDKIQDNSTIHGIIEDAAAKAASAAADRIVTILSFIITALLVWAILAILGWSFNIFNKIPILGGINRMAGILIGAAKGCIIVWLLCALLTAFSYTEGGKAIMEAVASNQALTYIYHVSIGVMDAVSPW